MKSLVNLLINQKIVVTQRVADTMLTVDRMDFMTPGMPACRAYADRAQPIPANVVISAPHLHGWGLEWL